VKAGVAGDDARARATKSKNAGRPAGRFSLTGIHRSGAAPRLHYQAGEEDMLYTLAVILLIAWLLGMVGTYTIGSFVHVLLVVAIVLFLVGLVSGRRVVP
jgi:hypothetical protein